MLVQTNTIELHVHCTCRALFLVLLHNLPSYFFDICLPFWIGICLILQTSLQQIFGTNFVGLCSVFFFSINLSIVDIYNVHIKGLIL